jgi:hypothetical protein
LPPSRFPGHWTLQLFLELFPSAHRDRQRVGHGLR